jgi:hypothetical protein
MRTLTLFNAYKKTQNRMSDLVRLRSDKLMFRHGHYGIAVDTDRYALQWQRRDRLGQKLDKEITRRLEEESGY